MKNKKMLIKTIVALAGITLTVTVLFFIPLWGTAALASLLSALSCYELLKATKEEENIGILAQCIICACIVPWLRYFEILSYTLPFLCVLLLSVLFLHYASKNEYKKSKTCFYCLSASIIPAYIFSLLIPILEQENGKLFILIPFVAAWGADTFAQFSGKLFGKHKLAENISPNKTVEGFIGGIIGTFVFMILYSMILDFKFHTYIYGVLLIFAPFAAIMATIGDLFFSYIKREHGIKDFSALMPEHGGILDRFDSVMFVLPLFYAFAHAAKIL